MNEFDFGEHFARLIRECEGKFRFRRGAETGLRQWQTPFRQSLKRVPGVANMERDLAGFVPDAELLDRVDKGSYVRESWRIRTEPTVPLPCYLVVAPTTRAFGDTRSPGRDDPIFPVAHTQAAFEQLAKVYRAAGEPDRCELYIGNGGHRYYKERVWPFFAEVFGAVR